MTLTTIPVRLAMPALPQPQVPISFGISVLVHLVVIALVAWLIRAMPEVARPANIPSIAPLQAVLTSQLAGDHALQMAAAQPAPPEPLPPLTMPIEIQPMSPAPPSVAKESPLIRTELPGISIDPATRVIDEPFAAVGHIVSSIGNGREQFGPNIAQQMKQRFPDVAARTPTLIGAFPMLYPARAAHDGRSLKLAALLMISAQGRVTEVRVLPDDPPFVQAIVAPLKGARFTPAERDGKPVAYWTIMEFRFDIDGPTGVHGERLDRQ